MREIMTWLLLALGSIYNLNAQTISEGDRGFINAVAQSNMLEVKLGELARTHGEADKVKILGEHMVADHTKAEEELKAFAAKKGVVVPTNLNEENYRIYNKLVKKQGKDFDKAFTKCMVKDHKKEIAEFEKFTKKGDDAELKTWAEKALPILEHHKTMSEEACKAVKKKS